jgi:hypothetical protein
LGADSWLYYTPYQEDVSQALEKLRQEENESRGFDELFQRLADTPGEEWDEELEQIAENFGSGTGTIYDIYHFSDVEAIKAHDLVRYFGTEKPTKQHAEIAFKESEIWQIIKRNKGYYVILYDADTNAPSEIAFAGFSGS